MSHPSTCQCGGSGYVERGPAGATYSYPCYPWDGDHAPGTRVEVEACPVRGEDGSVRGWVRLHTDRFSNLLCPTEFAICIDTTSFLSPYEARRFAQALEAAAERQEKLVREMERGDVA